MKKLKSHFWYTKSQRNGILFLLASIIGLQLLFHFINFGDNGLVTPNQAKMSFYQHQLDSLKKYLQKIRSIQFTRLILIIYQITKGIN